MQCGVEDDEESGQRVDFYHLDDCRQHEATAKWTRYSDRTDWSDHNHWRPEDFIAWVPNGGGGGGLSPAERAGFGGLEDLSGESISIPAAPLTTGPAVGAWTRLRVSRAPAPTTETAPVRRAAAILE